MYPAWWRQISLRAGGQTEPRKRLGKILHTTSDFIDPLHWVPVATDWIIRLSLMVEQGLKTLALGLGVGGGSCRFESRFQALNLWCFFLTWGWWWALSCPSDKTKHRGPVRYRRVLVKDPTAAKINQSFLSGPRANFCKHSIKKKGGGGLRLSDATLSQLAFLDCYVACRTDQSWILKEIVSKPFGVCFDFDCFFNLFFLFFFVDVLSYRTYVICA